MLKIQIQSADYAKKSTFYGIVIFNTASPSLTPPVSPTHSSHTHYHSITPFLAVCPFSLVRVAHTLFLCFFGCVKAKTFQKVGRAREGQPQ